MILILANVSVFPSDFYSAVFTVGALMQRTLYWSRSRQERLRGLSNVYFSRICPILSSISEEIQNMSMSASDVRLLWCKVKDEEPVFNRVCSAQHCSKSLFLCADDFSEQLVSALIRMVSQGSEFSLMKLEKQDKHSENSLSFLKVEGQCQE